jgi:hypothetical protein
VLEERELLVRRPKCEVVAPRGLAAALGAEGRIGEDHVGLVEPAPHGGEGVAEVHGALDAVEHQVHQREPPGLGDQLDADVGVALLPRAPSR